MGKMLIFHGGGAEIPQPEILVGNIFTESAMGGKINPLKKVSTNLKQESK